MSVIAGLDSGQTYSHGTHVDLDETVPICILHCAVAILASGPI